MGPESDLYSLGVVLCEMLTGRLPYEAADPIATAMKHLERPAPHPRDANPVVPEELDALVVRLLSKDPEERYPGAAELAEDLRRIRDGLLPLASELGGRTRTNPTVAAPTRRVPRSGDGTARRPIPRTLVAALLVGLALLVGVAWALTRSPAEQSPSDAGRDPGSAALAEVPDVTGLSPEEARRRLEGANLRLGSRNEAASGEAERGTVVGQDPAAGTRAQRGSAVDVTVGTGPARGAAGQPSPTASPTASPSAPPTASPSPASAGGGGEEAAKEARKAEEAAKEREEAREEALKKAEERRKAREEAREERQKAREEARKEAEE